MRIILIFVQQLLVKYQTLVLTLDLNDRLDVDIESNSVIGARTEKYADYFDICAAIIGKVPNIGVHLGRI